MSLTRVRGTDLTNRQLSQKLAAGHSVVAAGQDELDEIDNDTREGKLRRLTRMRLGNVAGACIGVRPI